MPDRFVDPDSGPVTTSDEALARLGEVAALRAIQQSMERMGQFLMTLNDRVTEMHTDVAVMKTQDERIRKIEHEQGEQAKRLNAIELTHAQDAGARKGLNTVREWAPFLLTILIAVFVLLKTGAIHL